MSIMKHIRNILTAPPTHVTAKQKVEGQLRREHGVVDGQKNKSLDWNHDDHCVHVLTSKKPLFGGKRKHSEGKWHTKTFHWNDNHKLTHSQNWNDQDHWRGEPPIRRIDGVHQENDRLDHMQENAIPLRPEKAQFKVGDIVTGPFDEPHKIYAIPTDSDGRDPKTRAKVHPASATGNDRFAGMKDVPIRHLTKVLHARST